MEFKSFHHQFSDDDFDLFLKNAPQFIEKPVISELLDKNQYQTFIDKYFFVENIVVICFGGTSSSLQAMINNLNKSEKKFIFIDHLDFDLISESINPLNLEKSLFLFYSKSGETKEVFLIHNFIKQKLNISHSIFISSDHQSQLAQLTHKNNYQYLHYTTSTPNRFNCFSPIHVISLGLAKINIEEFFSGYKSSKGIQNTSAPILFLHQLKNFNRLNICIKNTNHEFIADYLIGIWNESLGESSKVMQAQKIKLNRFFHSSIEYYASNQFSYFFIFEDLERNSYYDQLITLFLNKEALPHTKFSIKFDSVYQFGRFIGFFHMLCINYAKLIKADPFTQASVDEWKVKES